MNVDQKEIEEWDNFWRDKWAKLPNGGTYHYNKRRHQYQVIASLIPRRSSIYDYACGISVLGQLLRKSKKCIIYGSDISAAACLYTRILTGGQIYQTDQIIGSGYKYIMLNHILEHITNPREILLQAVAKAKNVIITIPYYFHKRGYHRNMQWKNLEGFEKILKGLDYKRVDNFDKTIEAAFRPYIYLVTGKG